MNNQNKVKSLIALAMLIIVVLFITVVIQLVNISKTQKEVLAKQEQIQQLEKQLDYYENKQPDSNYETVN